jgi:hypothetical protein
MKRLCGKKAAFDAGMARGVGSKDLRCSCIFLRLCLAKEFGDGFEKYAQEKDEAYVKAKLHTHYALSLATRSVPIRICTGSPHDWTCMF